MKKKTINFNSQLSSTKKISIKSLDFDKLPKIFNGINYGGNAFLNVTKSPSNKTKKNITSSLPKQKGKTFYGKPLTSRNRNENAVKLNIVPKSTSSALNINQGQSARPSNKEKPFNKLFAHSLYVSYNNSSSNCKTLNTKNQQTAKETHKTISMINKVSMSNSSSRNQSKINNLLNNNNSTVSICMNSKDSMNINLGINDRISDRTKNYINSYRKHESMTKSTISSKNINCSNGGGFKNHFKNFSNANLSNICYKKFGIRVKKTCVKEKNEEDFNQRKVNELFHLQLLLNFQKILKIKKFLFTVKMMLEIYVKKAVQNI